jgi:outer membrane protein OmpA-like peptidoglycan-associated protein/flagellar hook assembly protein FlgD
LTARSQTFVLDVSPPTGSVTFTPEQFTPADGGAVQPVTISIKGRSAVARMDSWSLDIIDEEGRAFHSFDGKWSSTEIQWDGKSSSGDWVAPSHAYYAQVTLRDEFGITSQVSSAIAVSSLPARAPLVPQTSVAIASATGGFSPNGDEVMDAIRFTLAYGENSSVRAWKVEVLDSNKVAKKTFSGDGSSLPTMVRWDGKNETGNTAQEGIYTARLSVEYGGAFKPASAVSSSFVLDTTPPTGSVTLSEPLFSPMEASPTITLSVNASSRLARIDSWKMEIYDPENHLFQTFHAEWPAKTVVWDGKGFKGDLVLSAEDYPVIVRVRDEFGNVGEVKSMIPVDILVEKTPTGFRILSSRIFFKPYTADYTDVKTELADQNVKRLADMAAKLRKFPNYHIRLVGHAVMIHWDNKALGDIEQREILLPLSTARAEAVKKAMIDRGLEASMFTAQGVGASDPLVLDSDFADRWRNRRVAFFIEK